MSIFILTVFASIVLVVCLTRNRPGGVDAAASIILRVIMAIIVCVASGVRAGMWPLIRDEVGHAGSILLGIPALSASQWGTASLLHG